MLPTMWSKFVEKSDVRHMYMYNSYTRIVQRKRDILTKRPQVTRLEQMATAVQARENPVRASFSCTEA